MIEPKPRTDTSNIAQGGATVGMQAENIHDSNVYIGSVDASPAEQFSAGICYLDAGMPANARQLIGKAISRGLDTCEVRFRWVLATLSRRSYRELDVHEAEQLACLQRKLPAYPDDGWKNALTVVCAILEGSQDPARANDRTASELDRLPEAQRAPILLHLALALTGATKNHLWTRILAQAERFRLADLRQERVWAYFQPEPARPRARIPADAKVPVSERLRIAAWSAVGAAAVSGLAWVVVASGSIFDIIAGLFALITGYLGFRANLEWHHRRTQLIAGDRAHDDRLQPVRARERGLANGVHNSFEYYAYRSLPNGIDLDRWISETAGIRNTLAEEISDCYRNSGVPVKRINWLIRYLVRSEIRDKWLKGTLLDHRQRYRTPPRIKVTCVACYAVSALSILVFLVAATVADPLLCVLLVPAALANGPLVGKRVFHVLAYRRTVAEQQQEYQRNLAVREAEYDRWKTKLERTRPDEDEMERWLDCDRTLFLDESMRSCRITWPEIVSHAFLTTPVRSSGRARLQDGPWRYGSYRLHLFLITHDGVREFATVLDFRQVRYNGRERHNYRFDAVASVHVAVDPRSGHSLELTLINGPERKFQLIDDPSPDSVDGLTELADRDLDATGFAHTFSLLEGIAAEGRNWITHDERRRRVAS